MEPESQGWFFAAGFAFEGPDGSRYVGTPNPDHWSFQPTWAISYISKNWVASANMAYFFRRNRVAFVAVLLVHHSEMATFQDKSSI